MDHSSTTTLRIGDWCVNPNSGEISRNGESARVEVRTMRLLLCLAEHAGEVVSIDDLLDQVWSGVSVAPDSVYQAVTSLRRLLGDDPKQPTYIETVPRLGYRMVAKVSPWVDPSILSSSSRASEDEALTPPGATAADLPTKSRLRLGALFSIAFAAAICVALVLAFLSHRKSANTNNAGSPTIAEAPANSIAVLPFLDLTDAMNQEPFADGMTEELIDKLSKVPSLHVPPPTPSFFLKAK